MLHTLSSPYLGVPILLGTGLLASCLALLARSAGKLLARFTFSGLFRPSPDPGMETMMRTAFAQFDQELAAILTDRAAPDPPWISVSRTPADGPAAATRQ